MDMQFFITSFGQSMENNKIVNFYSGRHHRFDNTGWSFPLTHQWDSRCWRSTIEIWRKSEQWRWIFLTKCTCKQSKKTEETMQQNHFNATGICLLRDFGLVLNHWYDEGEARLDISALRFTNIQTWKIATIKMKSLINVFQTYIGQPADHIVSKKRMRVAEENFVAKYPTFGKGSSFLFEEL